jgi:hypothetical protein
MPRKTPLKLVGPKSNQSITRPEPPSHLGEDGLALWQGIQAEYQIDDPAGLELLRQAAEAADRVASVRKQIDKRGEMLTIRGLPRVNPLCAVERDQRAALVRCLKNLNLDLEPLKARGRPPGIVCA